MHYTKLIDGNKIFTEMYILKKTLHSSSSSAGSGLDLKRIIIKKKVVTLRQIYDFALIFKYGDLTELRKCNKVQINI